MISASEWNEGFDVSEAGGFAQARLSPRPPCAFCGDTGRREYAIQGVLRAGRCRCQRLPDRIVLFNRAQIPARHARCTMENFRVDLEATKIGWAYTRRWLDVFNPE